MKNSTLVLGIAVVAAFVLMGGAAGLFGNGFGFSGGGGSGDFTTTVNPPPGPSPTTARSTSPTIDTRRRETYTQSLFDPRISYASLSAYEAATGTTLYTKSTQQGFGAPGVRSGAVPLGAMFGFGGDSTNTDGTANPYYTQERRAGLRNEAVGMQGDHFHRSPLRSDVASLQGPGHHTTSPLSAQSMGASRDRARAASAAAHGNRHSCGGAADCSGREPHAARITPATKPVHEVKPNAWARVGAAYAKGAALEAKHKPAFKPVPFLGFMAKPRAPVTPLATLREQNVHLYHGGGR